MDLLKISQSFGLSGHAVGSGSLIESALSRRLLWITDVELRDNGLPVNAEEPIDLERAESDWFSIDTPLAAMVQSRINDRDFRFLDQLPLDSDGGEHITFEDLHSANLVAERATLTEHKDRVRDIVEQAANDGVIEFEGSRWSECVNRLDDIVVDMTLNFKQAHDTLDAIEQSIEEQRVNRREELKGDWETLTKELSGDASLEHTGLEELSATFSLASCEGSLDIRVMEDCVTRIRDYLSSGERQDLVLNRSGRSSDALEGFLSFSRGIGDTSPYPSGRNLRHLLSRIRGEV